MQTAEGDNHVRCTHGSLLPSESISASCVSSHVTCTSDKPNWPVGANLITSNVSGCTSEILLFLSPIVSCLSFNLIVFLVASHTTPYPIPGGQTSLTHKVVPKAPPFPCATPSAHLQAPAGSCSSRGLT